MAFYEHTFIGKQDLSNKEVDGLVEKYSEIINNAGKIIKTEKWGLLNLANKVEKKISIDNNVIRFLTVKYKKLDLENQYIGENKKTNEKK